MLMPDWTIHAVYLHHDGYLHGGAGEILAEHYITPERVESLIELGDLSSLKPNIYPDAKSPHSWAHPQPDVTVAYHRDRGESPHPPTVFTDLYDYETNGQEVFGAEYLYLFVDDRWIACDLSRNSYEWKGLETMLQEKTP